jgi:hypothetical protein
MISTDPFQYIDGLATQPHGVQDVIVQDGLEQIILIICLKRRLARHHLVHKHTQRPPVHRRIVLQFLQNLRSNVVGGTAERLRCLARHHALLAHAKVSDLTVTFCVQQNIVQLEISVNTRVAHSDNYDPCTSMMILRISTSNHKEK